MTHPILALQAADTRADQLRHRRQNLPEQAAVDAARGQYAKWQQRRDGLERRLAELEAEIGRAEAESHTIDTHRARLEQQLKTIIAPREAEALMHEIALLTEQRGALDDVELAALEEQVQIDDDLSTHIADGASLGHAVTAAEDAAAAATAEIDTQLIEIAAGHDDLRAAVDDKLLVRYDQLRRQHVVAAAALVGTHCEGCHLDLSAAELDEVRSAAGTDGLAECPQCGRLLVV